MPRCADCAQFPCECTKESLEGINKLEILKQGVNLATFAGIKNRIVFLNDDEFHVLGIDVTKYEGDLTDIRQPLIIDTSLYSEYTILTVIKEIRNLGRLVIPLVGIENQFYKFAGEIQRHMDGGLIHKTEKIESMVVYPNKHGGDGYKVVTSVREGEVIHRCPIGNSSVTPCCGRTPFELDPLSRMAIDDSLVNCKQLVQSEFIFHLEEGLDND